MLFDATHKCCDSVDDGRVGIVGAIDAASAVGSVDSIGAAGALGPVAQVRLYAMLQGKTWKQSEPWSCPEMASTQIEDSIAELIFHKLLSDLLKTAPRQLPDFFQTASRLLPDCF